MNQANDSFKPRLAAYSILADVHFWVPIIVLTGGIALLAWVS